MQLAKQLLPVLAILLHGTLISGQSTCSFATFYQTRGDASVNEYATALLKSRDNHIYMAGRSGNQTFLQKMTPSGEILWNRQFQINPFEPFTPGELIEDSDGMIVGCGTQGSPGLSKGFVFRYNPATNTFFWSRSISSNNPVMGGIVEKTPGGNYVICQSALLSTGEREAEVIEINRITGAINPGLSRRYEYLHSDVFTKIVSANGALYLTGWSTSRTGTQANARRQLLVCLNPGTLDPLWAQLGHRDTLAPVSFTGRDLVVDGSSLVMAYNGSPEASPSGSGVDTIYLQKTDFNGNIEWVRSYSELAGVLKLISAPDGYFIYGQRDGNQHVVIKTDKNGVPLWSRKLTDGTSDGTNAADFAPNLAVMLADSVYLAGLTPGVSKDVMFWKMLSTTDPSPTDTCGMITSINVNSALVSNPVRLPITMNQVFSSASALFAGVPLQDFTMATESVCPSCVQTPGACPQGNDFILTVLSTECDGGQVNIRYRLCDLDGGQVPQLNVGFFDSNPFTTPANLIYSVPVSPSNTTDCYDGVFFDMVPKLGSTNLEDGDYLYMVVNLPSGATTPLDSANFPSPLLLECDYTNNLATFEVDLPDMPSLDLGPDVERCAGSTVTLDAGPGFHRYQWSNGSISRTANVTLTNQYRVTVTDDCGRTKADAIQVTFLLPTTASFADSLCEGETIYFRGQPFNQTGTYTLILPGANGRCDTIATLTVTKRHVPKMDEFVQLCPGDSLVLGTMVIKTTGIYTVTKKASIGCDTIVNYWVTIKPQPFITDSIGFCQGESVVIGGQAYSTPQVVEDTIPGLNGACNTIAFYELYYYPTVNISGGDILFCRGESVVIDGVSYTQPGQVTVSKNSTGIGCDTLITFTLKYVATAPSMLTVQCPANKSVTVNPGTSPAQVTYNMPTAASDCICPGIAWSSVGPASGANFPLGPTQVCYTAKDSCGSVASCCFTITVVEELACDVKEVGCVKYELLSITEDAIYRKTYRMRVTNNCPEKLVYTAIQLPKSTPADEPAENSVYTSPEGRQYLVRNPNYSPFYSIRFRSLGDSIANGQTATFRFTIPQQSSPNSFRITSRLEPQYFLESTLNIFGCPIGVTGSNREESGDRSEQSFHEITAERTLSVFPNPTSGDIYADVIDWLGQGIDIRVFDLQGRQILAMRENVTEDILRIPLPAGLSGGLYIMQVTGDNGERAVIRFERY
ncbi:MAG: hypothetical protein RLZ62_1094 [Bacteroidota bacterium]|jgi:hypothetical protein